MHVCDDRLSVSLGEPWAAAEREHGRLRDGSAVKYRSAITMRVFEFRKQLRRRHPRGAVDRNTDGAVVGIVQEQNDRFGKSFLSNLLRGDQ